MTTIIRSPVDYYADLSGRPIENGGMYIGVENQDPELNPIAVFWDYALTQPADQPLAISAGYVVHSGARAKFYTSESAWSLRVLDKSGSLAIDEPSVGALVSSDILASTASGSGAALVGFLQAGTGATPRTVEDKLREQVTPADFGAKGDHQLAYASVTMTAGSQTLVATGAAFTAADVGKYIFVPRCGSNGNALVTTITAYVSAAQVTLAAPAIAPVTAKTLAVRWGSNDGPALQAMFDYCFSTGLSWHIDPGPSGVYLTAQALNVRQCQNTFTNGRAVPAASWTIDKGATIKACATMSYVIRFGDESTDFSQFLRDSFITGGVIDCSFIADIGIDLPFGNVTTLQHNQVKNIKLKGVRCGSLTAPGASGGGQFNFNSSARDTDYVSITAITKANPAVVTAPDHNFDNGDVVTLVGITGMTQANLKFYRIANVTQTTFELVNTDGTGWGTFTGATGVSRCMPSMKVPRFVSAATKANPCVITFTQPHGFANGQQVYLNDLSGMTEIGTSAGTVFTVAGATSTTIQLQGVDSTGFTTYTGNGSAIEYLTNDQMQTWLWCENAPDVDTMANQISGVRLGICADPANSTGYDGKHIKNHMYNYSEAGEMFAAYVLGGDEEIIGGQVDGPFRHVCWWKGPRSKTVGFHVNYDPNLPTYDLYATVHRIDSGADLIIVGGGLKSGSNRILSDTSGYTNYLWIGTTRVNVVSFQASGWLTATDAVGFGRMITGAASTTTQSSFTRFVSVADSLNQSGEFYRKTTSATIENVTFSSDVGGTETTTCKILANGNLQNTNNSYGAISDRRFKENIGPARDYAGDFLGLTFHRYSLISERAEAATQFGLIADEVEAVFPGLVEHVPVLDDQGQPTGEDFAGVKYSIVNLLAAKVVQELIRRVMALEGKAS